MQSEKQLFVKRLVELAEELGYPEHGRQTQLAKRYGLAQPSVRKWFTGEAMPSHEIAVDLCRRSLISYEWLMTGRGPKFLLPSLETDPAIREASRLINALNEEDRALVLQMAKKLTKPEGNGEPPSEK